MSSATIQYHCQLPKDSGLLYAACNAESFAAIVKDLADYLREKIKYNADLTDDEMKAYGDIQTFLYDSISDYGLTLEYD